MKVFNIGGRRYVSANNGFTHSINRHQLISVSVFVYFIYLMSSSLMVAATVEVVSRQARKMVRAC